MVLTMRWGICGAGLISHDFVNAVQSVAANNKVVAVGARSLDRAQALADLFGVPRAYDSYEAVANDPEVDVVYVGVIHPSHKEVAAMCLTKGKPVLCEKPLTLRGADTRELVALAREKKLFLMEGYWSRFFPAYNRIRQLVDSGALGEVQSVEASFEVPIGHVPRMREKALGGGATLDIGCYPTQFAQWVMRERPQSVADVSGELFDTGVDRCARVELTYSGGRRAILNYNADVDGNKSACVTGTKGKVQIPTTFWSPTSLILPDGSTEPHPLPKGAPQKFNFMNSDGFAYEVEHVRHCLEKGLTESPLIPLDETLILADLYDTILQRLGVSYD